MTTEEIKQICIKGYLAKFGIQAAKHTTGGFMYLSPLRKETDPSFKVDENKNCWYDHGMGKGGSIIDLVMELDHCNFKEAKNKLEMGSMVMWTLPTSPCPKYLGIEITDVRSLEHPALISYIESRGISIDLASQYCKQVHYRNGVRPYFGIGIQNDAGAWELRNAKFKNGSSPKTITTINTGSYEVLVFEGLFDFLSFLALKKLSTLPADVVVLNSVNNLSKALGFIQRHSSVKLFLDNDPAGRKATVDIMRLVPDAKVVDCAPGWAPHNDLNDYLISKLKR